MPTRGISTSVWPNNLSDRLVWSLLVFLKIGLWLKATLDRSWDTERNHGRLILSGHPSQTAISNSIDKTKVLLSACSAWPEHIRTLKRIVCNFEAFRTKPFDCFSEAWRQKSVAPDAVQKKAGHFADGACPHPENSRFNLICDYVVTDQSSYAQTAFHPMAVWPFHDQTTFPVSITR